jgi:hypothetical protein
MQPVAAEPTRCVSLSFQRTACHRKRSESKAGSSVKKRSRVRKPRHVACYLARVDLPSRQFRNRAQCG